MKPVVVVAAAAALSLVSACTSSQQHAAAQSPKPSFVITSPRAIAAWAPFSLGANAPHRTLADGVQITDIDSGSGTPSTKNDVLTVEYIGWLSDGRQIASSDADGKPFQFTLGTGATIQGWEEGVNGMATGGIRRLLIPSALAYGAAGVRVASGAIVIPPDATLVFIIHLVKLTYHVGPPYSP